MLDKAGLVLTRRQLLIKGGAMMIGSLLLPDLSFASDRTRYERSLLLYNKHTGEWFKDLYWLEGEYIPESLKRLNYFLRDKLNNKVTQIDKRLLDLMHALQNKIKLKKPFEIICGYRSLETNNYLRKVSHGVAKNSLHVVGRAIDLRMEGINLRKLRDTARSLKAGGVGYYPRSGFVHVDVRSSPYYW
jgi:uncharacterized protein YcbK (DUF882 family)